MKTLNGLISDQMITIFPSNIEYEYSKALKLKAKFPVGIPGHKFDERLFSECENNYLNKSMSKKLFFFDILENNLFVGQCDIELFICHFPTFE